MDYWTDPNAEPRPYNIECDEPCRYDAPCENCSANKKESK